MHQFSRQRTSFNRTRLGYQPRFDEMSYAESKERKWVKREYIQTYILFSAISKFDSANKMYTQQCRSEVPVLGKIVSS